MPRKIQNTYVQQSHLHDLTTVSVFFWSLCFSKLTVVEKAYMSFSDASLKISILECVIVQVLTWLIQIYFIIKNSILKKVGLGGLIILVNEIKRINIQFWIYFRNIFCIYNQFLWQFIMSSCIMSPT